MSSSKSVESPISILHLELLCQIFMECRNIDIGDDLSPSSSPALLIRVCQYWRYVACNTPILWTKLSFGKATLQLKSPAILVSLSTACSSTLPIEVKVNILGWSPKTLKQFDLIVPSIQKMFAKCSLLDVTISIWHWQIVTRLFPPGSESSLPMLEVLRLLALVGKICAPRLRVLSTTGLEELKNTFGASRDSLRHLTMFGQAPAEPNASYFHNITRLSLTLYDPHNPPYPIISSELITRLSVHWMYTVDSNPARVLDYLNLPSLDTLDLVTVAYSDPDEVPDNQLIFIEDLISKENWDKFRHQLKSLRITRVDITAYLDPVNIYSSAYFPKLEELDLRKCPKFNLIVASLANPEHDAFPQLRSLTLHAIATGPEDKQTLRVSRDLLLGTLELRTSRGWLKYVDLVLPYQILSLEDLQRLHCLMDEHGVENTVRQIS